MWVAMFQHLVPGQKKMFKTRNATVETLVVKELQNQGFKIENMAGALLATKL